MLFLILAAFTGPDKILWWFISLLVFLILFCAVMIFLENCIWFHNLFHLNKYNLDCHHCRLIYTCRPTHPRVIR